MLKCALRGCAPSARSGFRWRFRDGSRSPCLNASLTVHGFNNDASVRAPACISRLGFIGKAWACVLYPPPSRPPRGKRILTQGARVLGCWFVPVGWLSMNSKAGQDCANRAGWGHLRRLVCPHIHRARSDPQKIADWPVGMWTNLSGRAAAFHRAGLRLLLARAGLPPSPCLPLLHHRAKLWRHRCQSVECAPRGKGW